MVFFLLILILVIFNEMKISPADSFNSEYLDKKSTTAINGIFVVLIVFSHYAQYADFSSVYDEPYLILREHLNQMVVASFMFYSGYGMMEAIRRKGIRYVNGIPGKFWKLLFRFDFAVILFLIMNAVFGILYPLKHTLLAFTSWTAVGNSNWYITAILILYVCMFISFAISMRLNSGKAGMRLGIAGLLVLTIAVVFLQMKIGRPGYCYNTMILLPVGCMFSEAKPLIERVVMRSDLSYLLTVLLTLGVYIVSFFHRWSGGIEVYTVWAISFILMVILITMKVRIFNSALEWFGSHVFSIYILQRIPMTILNQTGCIESHKYISLIVAFAVTLPLALVFEKVTDKLISLVERKDR